MAGLVVAGGLAPGSRADATRRPPGAIPSVSLDTVIHADQLALVLRGPDAAVAAARLRVDVADRRLGRDTAARSGDEVRSTGAGEARVQATAARGRAAVALGAAVIDHGRAVGWLAVARRQLQALAVGWYTGGAAAPPARTVPLGGAGAATPASAQAATPAAGLAAAEAATTADAELRLLTALTGGAFRSAEAAVARTATQLAGATAGLGRARTILAADVRYAADSAAILSSATQAVLSDQSAVRLATSDLAARQAGRARLVGKLDGSEGAGASPVPSILGPAAMTAGQIVAWFDAMGYNVATTATIRQLASWYLSEGAAEGVRGDIAFAQALVETGEFDSADAVRLNNYAGIGHCDACGRGVRFPSALAGVRGHIQLLRTYADPTLTAADLPSPPPVARLAPQTQAKRGCCRTWSSLTGVWASDRSYGTTVLEVYAEMLGSAVLRSAAAAGGG